MRRKRKILVTTYILLLGLTLTFAGCSLRWRRIERGFDRVSIGDSKEGVLAAMGKPSEHGSCGLVAGLSYQTPNCVTEFVYSDPFPFPDGYVVLFDQSGRVIHKSPYSSP